MAKTSSANLGFEQKLWKACDKMRNNMDPSEYKHVVLGLIFLKYISDSFDITRQQIINSADYYEGDEEDKDAYLAQNTFWVPANARWEFILAEAKKPIIGQVIDEAMIAIEADNPRLKGTLNKNYARPALDKTKLGEVIDLVSTISMLDSEHGGKDLLGRVYEYFLGQFASTEGKGGGEFYTPKSVVDLIVRMIEPYKGRIYDPCCGSGGMFVQSEKFVEQHGGRIGDISVYGQESNPTTWRLCKMNLAIRGIDGHLGASHADTFHKDLHADLKADYILANPPFNIKDWGAEHLKGDVRWKYGTPPNGNANYGWIQHMVHKLSPNGVAGFVMANGSMSSNTSGEGEIRKNLVEAGLVDCIVALPSQLFYSTTIPVCAWIMARNKTNRSGEVLFIDARKMGTMATRRHRLLTEDDMVKITKTYHDWRDKNETYEDMLGYCKAAKLEEIAKHGYVLTPGRYVGVEVRDDDPATFTEKMKRLTAELAEQTARSRDLEKKIANNLKSIGFEIPSPIVK